MVYKGLIAIINFQGICVMSESLQADVVNVRAETAHCPFHSSGADFDFQHWLQRDLMCSAGKREFRLGRYHVATVRNGADYAREAETFFAGVRDHSRTGFLAVVDDRGRRYANAEEELRTLGVLMQEAGLCENADAVVDGETISIEFEVECPVTGLQTTYSFFPVAFCRGSSNVDDPLYDPSLSAPFIGVNMTSDAFAFACLVRDQCIRLYGSKPEELTCIHAARKLFQHSVTTWQNMSVNTITSYNKRAACPERAVHLSDDRKSWLAPHNDPVFAETRKEMHAHEMPVIYAQNLCDSWLSTMFEAGTASVGREGQSGGILVA